jgi:3-oxoadipate enol-lactonase/4-carboxymuconolactone decarboxylase
MAFIQTEGARIYYRLDGRDDRPVLMLAHSLGVDHGMWDPQMPDLLEHVRVLRFDLRGHGASDAPVGEYSLERLARDAVAVADALSLDRVAFCGVSIGGMIGQWIGHYAPDRLTALILANTSPRLADPGSMEVRRRTVLELGMPGVVEAAMARFFTPEMLASRGSIVESTRRTFLATDPVGYAGCCAALRDMDLRGLLSGIAVRTLVLSGDRDESMPWDAHGALLARAIPHAEVCRLSAAHLSNLGSPRIFTTAVLDFLAPPAPAGSFDAGLAMRRAVLGEAYVDRALASATDLNREFQELITKFVWGTIWTRHGLDQRTRRLLVLAITAALGRWDEFRLHLGAALDHGLEWSDVKETLMQTAVYAGVPAANTAFHIAADLRDAREAAR